MKRQRLKMTWVVTWVSYLKIWIFFRKFNGRRTQKKGGSDAKWKQHKLQRGESVRLDGKMEKWKKKKSDHNQLKQHKTTTIQQLFYILSSENKSACYKTLFEVCPWKTMVGRTSWHWSESEHQARGLKKQNKGGRAKRWGQISEMRLSLWRRLSSW